MSLGRDILETWKDFKTNFLGKYKEYCKGSDIRGGDVFKMQQKEDESLKDYISRFLFYMHKSPQHTLNEES